MVERQQLDEPNEITLGTRGWVKYANNAQGLSLCRYFWPAGGKPKGIILLCHGHGSHTCFEYLALSRPGEPQTYSGSWVEAFNNAGFSVAGLDQQGTGRSQGYKGRRCFFLKFEDLVDEVLGFARWMHSSTDVDGFSGLNIFLLGISMGGCTATSVIHKEPSLFKGVILLAPMLSLEKVAKRGLNPYLRPLSVLLSLLVPGLPVAEKPTNTRFPDIQEAFDSDPGTYHGKYTQARVASEFLNATAALGSSMSSMDFPFLCIHSKEDTMTDPEGSQMLLEKSQAKDKKLELIDNMWHFLTHEPGNEKILEMVIEWVKQRSPQQC